MARLFMGVNDKPREITRLWIGTDNGNREIQKMWMGTSSGPKQIFGNPIGDAVFWLDASQEYNTGNEAYFYTNFINGKKISVQIPWVGMGGGDASWDFGRINDVYANGNSSIPGARPISFNSLYRWHGYGIAPANNRGMSGRGGTSFRFSSPKQDATLMIVCWVDVDRPTSPGPVFFNDCFFNAYGEYWQENAGGITYPGNYTGAEVGHMYWGSSVPQSVSMWDSQVEAAGADRMWGQTRRLIVCTMVTRGNNVVYRLTTRTSPTRYGTLWYGPGTVTVTKPKTNNVPIVDVRIFDYSGGGAFPFKGELYEAVIYDRSLNNQEIGDLENYFMNDKYAMLG